MKNTYRKNSIEGKLDSLLPQWPSYDVIALELWHDGESWSVNTPFRIASNVDRETAIERLASRWKTFKANYAKRARVCDLSDTSCEENESLLEVDCIPFADVRNASV
jgi:hypothetical protein